jgi:hypothetical protein
MNVDRYRRPIAMSDPGRHAALFDGLPRDTGALAETVQGLLIHQHIAPAYGVTLSRDQQAQSHVRAVEKILGDIVTRDGRPLSAARATDERQVGVCRHFTLLHVAMLRTQGIPARARCGFGAYFEKGKYLDHWVTEYWPPRGFRDEQVLQIGGPKTAKCLILLHRHSRSSSSVHAISRVFVRRL